MWIFSMWWAWQICFAGQGACSPPIVLLPTKARVYFISSTDELGPFIDRDFVLQVKKTSPPNPRNFAPTVDDRLLVEIKSGYRSSFPLLRPKISAVPASRVQQATGYGSFSDIAQQTQGQFLTALEVLGGLNEFAYRRYKATLSFKQIELEDIFAQSKHFKSDNISAVLADVVNRLGYEGYTAISLDRETGLSHSITLISESTGEEFIALDGDRVVQTLARDVEDALEQWSYYSGRVYPYTNIFNNREESVYLAINEFGQRIRPSNLHYPDDSQAHLNLLLHSDQMSLAFFSSRVGVQAGAIRGYGPLEWSPFFRISASRKYSEYGNTAEFYLDTSYMRGGAAFYYFRQKDQDGVRRDRFSLIMELGTEFGLFLDESDSWEVIMGFNYLNDWGLYYDVIDNRFKIESIPSSFIEATFGLRRHFEFGKLAFHLTPFVLGRYSSYSLQNPLPFVYGNYGIRGRLFYPVSLDSHILLDASARSAFLREHLFWQWYIDCKYEDMTSFAVGFRYEERMLLQYTKRKAIMEISRHMAIPLEIGVQGAWRIDEERYELSISLRYDDL